MAFPRSWTVLAASAFLVLACAASVSRADQVDNPAYKAWSNFKVGSSTTLAGSIDASSMKIELEMKQTLVELTDDHATVETVVTTTIGGQAHPGQPHSTTIPAKAEKPEWKEVGTEDVKAMDKTFSCKVVEGKRSVPARGGQMIDASAKLWVSSDVPGGMVQMKFNSTGGPGGQAHEMSYLLKSFEAK